MSHVSCQEVKTKHFCTGQKGGDVSFLVLFVFGAMKARETMKRHVFMSSQLSLWAQEGRSKKLWVGNRLCRLLEGFKSLEVQNLASDRCWWHITLIKSLLICSRYTRVLEQWSTKRHGWILILKCGMMHGDLGHGHVRFQGHLQKEFRTPQNRLMSPGRWGEVDEPRRATVMAQSLSEGGLPGTQSHPHRNLGWFAVRNAFRSWFCYKRDFLEESGAKGWGLCLPPWCVPQVLSGGHSWCYCQSASCGSWSPRVRQTSFLL